MRLRKITRQAKKARIEIIPMIDTMFFLLVFFMIATLSMTVMRGVPVNLPKTESGDKVKKESHLITVDQEGGLFLDKKETPLTEIYNALRTELAADSETLVIINADEGTSHGRVMEVMDTVKLAGVTRLAFATKPKQENP